MYTDQGGFLHSAADFDPGFFGIDVATTLDDATLECWGAVDPYGASAPATNIPASRAGYDVANAVTPSTQM